MCAKSATSITTAGAIHLFTTGCIQRITFCALCTQDIFTSTSCLRGKSVGVSGEHRGLADVLQAQVEHHHALQADAAAAVGQRAVLEGVDVALDRRDGDAALSGALHQQVHVVDTLRAGDDLLAADEQVVAVGPAGVVRVGHRVEGPGAQGVLVHDVEVGAVLLGHQLAKQLLVRRGDVLVSGSVDARLLW
jgi:ABC-type lipopolysaccharide export system ATPase subunit